ncbi:MAG: glycosyltransferase family 25 protein [Pontimonas sp.]
MARLFANAVSSTVAVLIIATSAVAVLARRRCRLVPIPPYDVFVINLDRATTRLDRFKQSYRTCDISLRHDMIRFPAVDGRRLTLPEHLTEKALLEVLRAERQGHRTKHYQLTRGGVGCYLSHVRLWQSVLDTDKDAALIFEDDSIIDPDIGDVIDGLAVPDDTDLLLLGYFCNKCKNTTCGVIRVTQFFGLHGYLITRRGIEKILAHPDVWQIGKQIDSWLSDLARTGYINVYATHRQHVVQDHTAPTQIQMVLKPPKGSDPWE